MKKTCSIGLLVLILVLAGTTVAKADTVTDTKLNVTYTATSTFAPGPGNTFDVFLTVDPTGFNAGTGFLTALSLQFKTGSDVSTSVLLLEAPGWTWRLESGKGRRARLERLQREGRCLRRCLLPGERLRFDYASTRRAVYV